MGVVNPYSDLVVYLILWSTQWHISIQMAWCWVPSLTATLTCYHIHLPTPHTHTHTHTNNKVHIIIFIQCTVQVTFPFWWLTVMNNYTGQQKAYTVNARYLLMSSITLHILFHFEAFYPHPSLLLANFPTACRGCCKLQQ